MTDISSSMFILHDIVERVCIKELGSNSSPILISHLTCLSQISRLFKVVTAIFVKFYKARGMDDFFKKNNIVINMEKKLGIKI